MSENNKRSVPSDGFGEQQQVRKVKILEEASTSQTPNIQNVRDNQGVENLTRYLFDLIRERESANETEKDAITERIKETGISKDIENNILFEIEDGIEIEATNMNYLRPRVSQERIRKLRKRAREIAKENAIERVCNLVRVQANVAPDAIDWREDNSVLCGIHNIMEERSHKILDDLLFDQGFSVVYQTMNFNNRLGLVGYTVANQGKQKANIVRSIVRNCDERPEIVRSRITIQDNNWDIVVPQFENGQIVDKSYRIVRQDGQIQYDTLKFLHQSGIALSKNDSNLKNLLLTVLYQIQNEPLIKGNRELEQIQRQNAFLVSFITQEIENDIISFFSNISENRFSLHPDNSDIDCSLFGLTLNNNKQDIVQLRKQNELLNSIIKNNIQKLNVINCTIDKVPDEMFGLRGIYFFNSTVTLDDMPTIPQETEMMQVFGRNEDGRIVIRYTELAINQERKKRILKIKGNSYRIENKVNKNDIINYLNSYKNRIAYSNSDLNVIEKSRTEEYNKLEYLRNLLSSLQEIDNGTKTPNLDNIISRIREMEENDGDSLLMWRDQVAEQNHLVDMVNNFDFDNLGDRSTADSDNAFDSQQGANQ